MKRTTVYMMLGLLTVGLWLTGCRPKGILHSWEMRDVMTDLHKTDALLLTTGVNRTEQETKNIYYAQVLEKHGITQAEFDSSLVWYTAHPKLFDKIYPKVLKKLKSEEEAFLALHEAELNLQPGQSDKSVTVPETPALTPERLDSTCHALRTGYPVQWGLVHDSENQLLP